MLIICRRLRLFLLAGLLGGSAITVWAATQTSTFLVQATVVSDCSIVSASTMDFGSVGVLDSTYETTGTLVVNCTPSTTYSLSLDAGSAPQSTIADRRMASGSNSLQYQLYQDAAHTQVWGNTVGTDVVSGTGTGLDESVTIYGLIPTQSSQPPGAYASTVTVTVTY